MVYDLNCELCRGKGGWEDHIAQQTVFCPLCRPVAAEHRALARINLPGWDKFWISEEAKYPGPFFQVEPWLLVLHCGSTDGDISHYFTSPGEDKNGKPRKVSAHLAWSNASKSLRQCVPFVRSANHCGGSTLFGNNKLNYCSIGIELQGPETRERTKDDYELITNSVKHLKEIIPSLTTATAHSTIDKSNRRDPGKNFDWSYIKDCGLKIEH